MKTLNVLGGGKVATALCRLFFQQGVFRIGDIVNRTPESAARAAVFIGAGRAVSVVGTMSIADVHFLGVPDSHLAASAAGLAASGLIRPGNIVFHASGAAPSQVLAELRAFGAHVASVHPLRSFADPAISAETFAGTFCAAEGDEEALRQLTAAFTAIGARIASIEPASKLIYHASSVAVSNLLTALIEAGLQGFERCGIDRSTASQMIEPLVKGTVDNIFRTGTVEALTGPVARGDVEIVESELSALAKWKPLHQRIYRDLSAVALELSKRQRRAPRESLNALDRLLVPEK